MSHYALYSSETSNSVISAFLEICSRRNLGQEILEFTHMLIVSNKMISNNQISQLLMSIDDYEKYIFRIFDLMSVYQSSGRGNIHFSMVFNLIQKYINGK